MLAVLQLRFLCAAHRGFARSMLALSQEEAAYFPLATVSINVTAITLQVLRSKSCHRLLLEECDGYRSAPDPLGARSGAPSADGVQRGAAPVLMLRWKISPTSRATSGRSRSSARGCTANGSRRLWTRR